VVKTTKFVALPMVSFRILGIDVILLLPHFSNKVATMFVRNLTLTLLTWRIWRASTNASKWQMGFNSAFKGLMWLLAD
jgi:hypothetical protein